MNMYGSRSYEAIKFVKKVLDYYGDDIDEVWVKNLSGFSTALTEYKYEPKPTEREKAIKEFIKAAITILTVKEDMDISEDEIFDVMNKYSLFDITNL